MPRQATASIYALALESGLPVAILIERVGGEVVLVNDRYGIRLTRVVPSTDRLQSI
jgi:flagellar motor switch protein FliN/FliY